VSQPEELAPESFAATIAALTNGPGCYLAAEEAGKIVGHGFLKPRDLQAVAHVFVLTIAVHPGHSGRGIGTAIMAALADWARRTPGVEKVELLVRSGNEVGMRLYRKFGFSEEGRFRKRIRLPDGRYLDDVAMAWFPKEDAVVRRAIPADTAAACEVVRRSITQLCVEDHRGDVATIAAWLANKTPENFAAWISSPRHSALTAEKGASIAGFALLNAASGTIVLLYVAPEFRYAGVSKGMLGSLEKHAIAMGIRQLTLESSITALSFYERRGYSRVGDAVQGFGVTRCYPLAKTL